MTILMSTRAFSIGKVVDTTPITSASKFILPTEIEASAPLFWKELGFRRRPLGGIPKSVYFSQYHQTSKVSPYLKYPGNPEIFNNKNALWFSVADLMCIPQSLYKSICTVGGPLLESKMNTVRKSVEQIPELGYFINTQPSNNFRKISWFPDKELKTRVIAIGDYYSQTALRGLHKFLFKVLKRIPQDRTFNQGDFSSILNKEIYYSYDLSSATDRFPIEVIYKLMIERFPTNYCLAWKDIMVGYPFAFPQDKTSLSYTVGNPMGFYSSWSSFALAHHFMMFIACQRINMPWKDAPYLMLGDDVLICDKDLALAYHKIMVEELDIKISEPKSFISPHFFEFAKRLFWKGVEVSPFPISSLRESLKSLTAFVSLILESETRGWISDTTPDKRIEMAFAIILNMRSKLRSKYMDKSFVIDQILRCIRGTLSAGTCISAVFSKLGYPLGPINDSVGSSILENIVVDLFSQQPEMKFDKDAPSCFDLAANLVMLLTGLDDSRLELGLETIYALPHTQVYGQIEELYTGLLAKARQISTTGGGQ